MKRLVRFLSLLLCAVLLTGCAASDELLIAAPEVPVSPPYPDEGDAVLRFSDEDAYTAWHKDVRRRMELPAHAEELSPFVTASVRQILTGSNDNRICSPLSLYMAMSMLAETTDGPTRQELLTALGAPDMPTLRTWTSNLWESIYRDDGKVTRTLAASAWLADDIPFRRDTLETLTNTHHAAIYQGRMGSPETNAALQRWLNDNTMNLLQEQVATITLPPQTTLALASTVAFAARWQSEFNPADTTPGTFAASQGDLDCTYLRSSRRNSLYWGERFQAAYLPFGLYAGGMWLILPDEGVTVDELLTDEDCLRLIASGNCDNARNVLMHLWLPQFDVSSQLELSDALRALGVRRVFDPSEADFSPLTDAQLPIALSQVRHDARVVIDEEGCKAAAYTVMVMLGAAPPSEVDEINFILDRPFLFTITGTGGLPLFAGVVNEP